MKWFCFQKGISCVQAGDREREKPANWKFHLTGNWKSLNAIPNLLSLIAETMDFDADFQKKFHQNTLSTQNTRENPVHSVRSAWKNERCDDTHLCNGMERMYALSLITTEWQTVFSLFDLANEDAIVVCAVNIFNVIACTYDILFYLDWQN